MAALDHPAHKSHRHHRGTTNAGPWFERSRHTLDGCRRGLRSPAGQPARIAVSAIGSAVFQLAMLVALLAAGLPVLPMLPAVAVPACSSRRQQ
jgi:hypothetical protein